MEKVTNDKTIETLQLQIGTTEMSIAEREAMIADRKKSIERCMRHNLSVRVNADALLADARDIAAFARDIVEMNHLLRSNRQILAMLTEQGEETNG